MSRTTIKDLEVRISQLEAQVAALRGANTKKVVDDNIYRFMYHIPNKGVNVTNDVTILTPLKKVKGAVVREGQFKRFGKAVQIIHEKRSWQF